MSQPKSLSQAIDEILQNPIFATECEICVRPINKHSLEEHRDCRRKFKEMMVAVAMSNTPSIQ